MTIRFNDTAAVADLRRRLVTAMTQLQGEFLLEAQSGMRTPEGASSLYEGDVTEAAGIIAAQVIGGADAAMDSMGTGSLMLGPEENPGFDAYRNSPLWNPSRDDTTIRSRERGDYTSIYGDTRHSRSNRGGIDLERKGGKFAPQPPSHALQTAARWMANGRMQAVIGEVMSGMPWGSYLLVTDK